MAVYKIVMYTFVFVCKAGKASGFSQGRKFFVAAGKKFVGITLMAYIPDNCILGTIKYTVKSNCKFYDTKVTGKMSTIFSDNIYYSCTDFLSQLLEFFLRKLFNVFWRMNLRK